MPLSGPKRWKSLIGSGQSLVRWPSVFWQIIHLCFGGLLLMFVWLLSARVWGAARFGWFNYLYTIAAMGALFADFGLDVLLTRFIADGRKGFPASLVKLKSLSIVVTLILFALFTIWLPDTSVLAYSFLLCGVLVFSATNFFNGMLRGVDRLDLEAKIGLAQKLVFSLSSIGGLWVAHYGLIWVAFCYLISQMGACVATFAVLRSKGLLTKKKTVGHMPATWFYEAWPIFGIALLKFLSLRVDVFLLQWLSNSTAVGIYSAAYRYFEAAILIAVAFLTALFPRMVAKRRVHTEILLVLKNAFWVQLSAALLLVAAVWALAPVLTTKLMGAAFVESAHILRGLAGLLPAVFISLLFGQVCIVYSKQRTYILVVTTALVVSIFVAVWSIPLMGPWGAVVGIWAREVFQVTWLGWFLFKGLVSADTQNSWWSPVHTRRRSNFL